MRFFSTLKMSRGFSLIELLVVISIVGMLAGIVYANYGSARTSARDSIRQTNLKDLQLALELYKAQNGQYPLGCKGSNVWSGNIGIGSTFGCSAAPLDQYIVGLVPQYIPALPVDPKTSTDLGYVYRSDGNNYKVMARGTVETKTVTYGDEFYRCPLSTADASCPAVPSKLRTYAVYSPGAAAW